MISASAAGARSGYSGPARPADTAPRETRSRRTDLAAKALFRSSWLFSQSARLRTPHARESFPRNRATAFSFTQAVSLALDAATGCKRKQRRDSRRTQEIGRPPWFWRVFTSIRGTLCLLPSAVINSFTLVVRAGQRCSGSGFRTPRFDRPQHQPVNTRRR